MSWRYVLGLFFFLAHILISFLGPRSTMSHFYLQLNLHLMYSISAHFLEIHVCQCFIWSSKNTIHDEVYRVTSELLHRASAIVFPLSTMLDMKYKAIMYILYPIMTTSVFCWGGHSGNGTVMQILQSLSQGCKFSHSRYMAEAHKHRGPTTVWMPRDLFR